MDKLKEDRIRNLLSSFYDGSISQESLVELCALLEEEGDVLPADLQLEREVVREWANASSSSSSSSLMPIESEIAALRLVSELASSEKRRKRMRWINVAAVAALLVSIGTVAMFIINPTPERDAYAKAEGSDSVMVIRNDSVAKKDSVTLPQQVDEIIPKQLIAKEETTVKSKAKKSARKPKSTELTEEEKAARDIAEVQALLDAIAAEWDNADRGVRGLLTNRGMLANADTEEVKSGNSQDNK